MLLNFRLQQIKRRRLISATRNMPWILVKGFFGATAVTLKHLYVDVCYNNNVLAQLNDCIGGLFHLGPNAITLHNLPCKRLKVD